VFIVMYRVVLPLAGLQAWTTHRQAFWRAIGAHVVAVGWPIAFWTTHQDGAVRDDD
jgi:hypothetical protein